MANATSRRRVLKSVTATGAVISIAGCTGGDGGDSGDGGDGDDGSDGGSGEPIKLGITEPLSGPYASVGENQVAALKTAIQLWSEETGREIEAVVKDTEVDPSVGTRVAQELIDDEGVHMLTGSYSSAVGLAIGQVAQDNKVPYITTAGSTAFTGEECKRYAFATNPTVYATSYAIGQYALENLGSSFYLMTHNYTAGETGSAAAQEIISAGGGTIGDSRRSTAPGSVAHSVQYRT